MSETHSPLANFLPELERLVDRVGLEDGPALLGDLERIKARLFLRLIEASRPPAAVALERREPDRLLTVPEAATMLGVTSRWLYDHTHELPARVELPGRITRFSKRKLERWIQDRSA